MCISTDTCLGAHMQTCKSAWKAGVAMAEGILILKFKMFTVLLALITLASVSL